MKFTTPQPTTAAALGIVGRAAASRSSLPVLGNVLIDADGEVVRYTATDLEVALTVEAPAKVEQPGRVTLPAKTLTDLVNSLPGESLTMALTAKTQTTTMTCGRVKSSIKGIAAEEFPTIQRIDRSKASAIDAQALKAMLGAVTFAAAKDDTRPILRGVYLRIGDGRIKLAASDGFRVAEIVRDCDGPTVAAVLPLRAAEILRAIIDGAEEVLAQIEPERATFKAGDVELVAQLVAGEFPRYEAIIPKSHTTRAAIATRDGVKACKTVDVIARDASHTMRMEIGVTAVTLGAVAAETGDGASEIDATVAGPGLTVGVNATYMAAALDAIEAPQAVIEFGSATSPLVVRPLGDDRQLCVIMPVHTGK